jgi:glucokinase
LKREAFLNTPERKRFNPDQAFLTVDIGGTKTAVAVGFNDGRIADRVEFSTGNPETTLAKIVELGKPLIARHAPAAVGISCGGPMSSQAGLVLGPPNLPGWEYVEVVKVIKNAFGLPAFLENDANAGALAEWLYGAGRGFDNVIFLTCGTGLGAGLILDGRLYRGKQDLGGEVGHIRMEPDGPIGYFKHGSLEGFASGGGLGQLARKRLSQPHSPSILDGFIINKITGKEVGQAALAGDAVARELVQTSGRYLGQGLAILIDILNPECIVLGAMAVRLGNLLLDPAWEEVKKEALEPAWKNCKILPAQLSEKIGDVAALCVAKYNLEHQ